MKKIMGAVLFAVFLAALCGAFLYGNLHKQVRIHGYVLAGDPGMLIGPPSNAISVTRMYQQVHQGAPLAGVKILMDSDRTLAQTDAEGYFNFTYSCWFFQNQSVNFSVEGGAVQGALSLSLADKKSIFVTLVAVAGGRKPHVFVRADGELAKTPVVLTGRRLFSLMNHRPATDDWQTIIDYFKQEGLESRFAFFVQDVPPVGDFRQELENTASDFRLIRHLTEDTPVLAVGYSSWGVFLRYFTMSDLAQTGNIQAILQVAPPNDGIAPPQFVADLLNLDREALLEATRADSKLVEALHCDQPPTKPVPGNDHHNDSSVTKACPDKSVPMEIIAGDVVSLRKETLVNTRVKAGATVSNVIEGVHSMAEWLGYKNDWSQEWQQSNREKINDLKVWLDRKAEPSDLLVPVKSALLPGVPYTILPYNHFDIISPEGLNDPRYLLVRDFLLRGGPPMTKEPEPVGGKRGNPLQSAFREERENTIKLLIASPKLKIRQDRLRTLSETESDGDVTIEVVVQLAPDQLPAALGGIDLRVFPDAFPVPHAIGRVTLSQLKVLCGLPEVVRIEEDVKVEPLGERAKTQS